MKRLRTAALAAVAIGGASLALAGPATAAEPGQTCQVHGGATWWVSLPSGGGYSLVWPQYFYIHAYGTPSTYIGHGNGQPDGYLDRNAINQATCYW